MTDDAIGVVITCRVPAAQLATFEQVLREIIEAAVRQPGHLSSEVLRGPSGTAEQEFHIVYRFADRASLAAWDGSSERQALLARLAPLSVDTKRRESTGYEAWFDLPLGPRPLRRHRVAFLTWLGAWPLVSLSTWLVAPILSPLPFLLRTALNSALLIGAMTYLVWPQLARLAKPWLQGS